MIFPKSKLFLLIVDVTKRRYTESMSSLAYLLSSKCRCHLDLFVADMLTQISTFTMLLIRNISLKMLYLFTDRHQEQEYLYWNHFWNWKILNFVIYTSKPSNVLGMTGPVVTWFYRTCQVLSLNIRLSMLLLYCSLSQGFIS